MSNQQSCLELRSKAPQGFEESVAHNSENNEQTTEYDYSTQSISTYTDSNCTPFPSMTKSQRVKLNEILHREPIGYASTFNTDITEPVEPEHVEHAEHAEYVEEQEQKQNQNNGCCIIM